MKLGKNIAALRKARGMTQEQLGQALGISGQAVSKWEKGGTPDAEMLPAIADRLGVTIDTLYGRSEERTEDMRAVLLRWLATFPPDRRMSKLFWLLCCTMQRPYYVDEETLEELMDALFHLPVKSCYSTGIFSHTEDILWLRSAVVLEEGIQLAIPAEDCPLFLLMPEPGEGYESNFTGNGEYRALFSALALPGALEILRFLYGKKQGHRSAKAIAKASGVPVEDAERALDALTKCYMLRRTEVELEDAPVEVYQLVGREAFVPFLLLARWMCEKSEAYFCNWVDRDTPILREEISEGEKK